MINPSHLRYPIVTQCTAHKVLHASAIGLEDDDASPSFSRHWLVSGAKVRENVDVAVGLPHHRHSNGIHLIQWKRAILGLVEVVELRSWLNMMSD